MARSLRRSSRLKDKSAPVYVDPLSEDSDFEEESESNISSSQSLYDPDETEDTESQCICGKYLEGRMMICCDACNIWYHHDCAKLSITKSRALSKSKKKWFCPRCKSKDKQKKQNTRSSTRIQSKSTAKRRNTTKTNNVTKSKPTRKRKRTFVEGITSSVTVTTNPRRSKRRRVANHVAVSQSESSQSGPVQSRRFTASTASNASSNVTNTSNALSTRHSPQQAIRHLFSKSLNVSNSNCSVTVKDKMHPFQLPFAPPPAHHDHDAGNELNECPNIEIQYNEYIPIATSSFSTVTPTPNTWSTSCTPGTGYESCNSAPPPPPTTMTESANEQTDSDLEILNTHRTALNVHNEHCNVMDTVNEEVDNSSIDKTASLTPPTKEFSVENTSNDVDEDKDENGNESESESDSDSEIEIQAGDSWIGSSVYLKNKESIQAELRQQKRETLSHLTADLDEESDSDEDNDFVVLNANKKSKNDICPLTQQKIVKPIRNMLCPHVYERQAIKNYKKYWTEKKKNLTCPQGGCQALLVVTC